MRHQFSDAPNSLMKIGRIIGSNKKISLANRAISSLVTAGLGYAKEVSDAERRGKKKLDHGDLIADGAGVIYANILVLEF